MPDALCLSNLQNLAIARPDKTRQHRRYIPLMWLLATIHGHFVPAQCVFAYGRRVSLSVTGFVASANWRISSSARWLKTMVRAAKDPRFRKRFGDPVCAFHAQYGSFGGGGVHRVDTTADRRDQSGAGVSLVKVVVLTARC